MCYEQHKFLCLNCGGESIPIQRSAGHKHKDWHRKKLYCPRCKCVLNHMEIKDYGQQEQFFEWFNEGKFIEEAQESIKECERM